MLNGDDDQNQNAPGEGTGPSGWSPADIPSEPESDEATPVQSADQPTAGASPAETPPVAPDQTQLPPAGAYPPPAGAVPWPQTQPQSQFAPQSPTPPQIPGQPQAASPWAPPVPPTMPGWPPTTPMPPTTPSAAPNPLWQPNPAWPQANPPQPQQPAWPSGQGWTPGADPAWRPVQPGQWPAQQPWPPTGQPGQPGQPGWRPVQSWQPVPPTMAPTGSGTGMPSALAARRTRLPQILGLVAACMISFSAGMAFDRLAFNQLQPVSTAQPSAVAADVPLKDFQLYEQALQIVKQNYVGRSGVTDQQLLYGSIRGMVEALGDTGHSTFLTPEEYQASQSELSGNVAGIGVLLSTDNGAFTITKVLPGTPADTAGVKAGDEITAVDGQSVAGLSFDVFASKIRGKPGTQVTITVVRAGVADPIDITMTREVITVPLVSWGMVPGTHVADIALFEFSNGASDQIEAAITAATKAGATSIVFDLRGNPGGYAVEAVNVASAFLSGGTVYLTEDAAGNQTKYPVNSAEAHTSLPMVILVNHDSASAAEIVAGALQDNKRGKIVGVPTFGTGTVLQQFKLSDGSAILLGTAYWLTPDGHKIFGKGIAPDQNVALAAGAQPLDPTQLGAMSSAQLDSSGDAELLAAVKDLNP